jgi:hypothetical protein
MNPLGSPDQIWRLLVLLSVVLLGMMGMEHANYSINKVSTRCCGCWWWLLSSSADRGSMEGRPGGVWPPQPCRLVVPSPLALPHGTRGSPRLVFDKLLWWGFVVEAILDGGPSNKCVVAVPLSTSPMRLFSFRLAGVARGRRILVWCFADLIDGAVNAPSEALGCSSFSWPASVAR